MQNTRKYLIVLFILVLMSGTIYAGSDPEKYYPYPVIFIHGINSSSETWETTIGYKDSSGESQLNGKLGSLFAEGNERPKYPAHGNARLDKNNAVRFVDYGSTDPELGKMGDAKKIAESLKKEIDSAAVHWDAAKVPPEKVGIILVCHSYGGIITRYFIHEFGQKPAYKGKSYKSLIKKVVFIGVPHKGSPLASAMWIINNPKSQLIHGIRRNISANIEFQKSSTDHRGYACVF